MPNVLKSTLGGKHLWIIQTLMYLYLGLVFFVGVSYTCYGYSMDKLPDNYTPFSDTELHKLFKSYVIEDDARARTIKIEVGDIVDYAPRVNILKAQTDKRIGRVVATEGQLFEFRENGVYINGDEPYDEEWAGAYKNADVSADARPYTVPPIIVPRGHVYVLTSRASYNFKTAKAHSAADSRLYGPVPVTAISGVIRPLPWYYISVLVASVAFAVVALVMYRNFLS